MFEAISVVGVVVIIVSVQMLLPADNGFTVFVKRETSVRVSSNNSTTVGDSGDNLGVSITIRHYETNVTHIITVLSLRYSPIGRTDLLSFSVAVDFYAQASNYGVNETAIAELSGTDFTKTWNRTDYWFAFTGIGFHPYANGTFSIPASVQEPYSLSLTWDVKMIMYSLPDEGFNCTLGLAVSHTYYVYVGPFQQLRTWTVALGAVWLLIVLVVMVEARRVIVIDDT
jgi:hypothetical protein